VHVVVQNLCLTSRCHGAEPVTHLFTPNHILVSCSKGILNDSLETVNEILQRLFPPAFHPCLAYLSGPSFAAEVAKDHPTAVTIASTVLHKCCA
jgi:glycerol-3-phosphate dehydrogenase (NAD(P)+)